jgi:hypothetical protein
MSITAAAWITIAALWASAVLKGPAQRDRRLAWLRFLLPRLALLAAVSAAVQVL